MEVGAEKPEEGAPEETAQSRVTVGRGHSPVALCGRGRAESGGQRVCPPPVRVPDWPTWCIGAQPPAGTCAPAGPEEALQLRGQGVRCRERAQSPAGARRCCSPWPDRVSALLPRA